VSGQIAIGVDLGGTAFKVGLLDVQGKLIAQSGYPTPVGADPNQILGEIAQKAMALAQADAPGAPVTGIGIGIPGPVDPQSGIIKQCPNLHALDGANAVEILKQATGLPAFIGNDAFCATLAELRHGAGRGASAELQPRRGPTHERAGTWNCQNGRRHFAFEQFLGQRRLLILELSPTHEVQYAADARALVGDPLDALLSTAEASPHHSDLVHPPVRKPCQEGHDGDGDSEWQDHEDHDSREEAHA
jgi:hypothetical protein